MPLPWSWSSSLTPPPSVEEEPVPNCQRLVVTTWPAAMVVGKLPLKKFWKSCELPPFPGNRLIWASAAAARAVPRRGRSRAACCRVMAFLLWGCITSL